MDDYWRVATARAATFAAWVDHPAEPLGPDLSRDEYRLRVARARAWLAERGLDALVVTSAAHGRHFTGEWEPHEWHDGCPARATWYVLTPAEDHLWLNPGMGGEHLSSARRLTRVSRLHAMVERGEEPGRVELWDVRQLAGALRELGLARARLGFELGDCTTLGLSYLDFERLRRLLPQAELTDGAPVLRRCRQIQTPEEVARTRVACQAAEAIHRATPHLLDAGLSERELMRRLRWHFEAGLADQAGLSYRAEGGWDLRSAPRARWSPLHPLPGEWTFAAGDVVARGTGGTSYRGYPGDVDRTFSVGPPSDAARRRYAGAVACLEAMREAIRPGAECADVFAAYAHAAAAAGWPERVVGRQGHGIFNGGGISIHPDCHLVLETGMIVSCEPVLATDEGLFDVEDQFVVTESGCERLHRPVPEEMPTAPA